MTVIRLLQQAEAADQHRAVRTTAVRHRHLADQPFVVAAYNLSGEAAAPLALCYGTDPDDPTLVVAAEPRNRDARFAAINQFAADLHAYIGPFLDLEERQSSKGYSWPAATDAPQIVVANRATRDYLGARLGRSLRYLGLGSTHPVPEETVWAGSHLSWLAEHAHRPGQSVFLAATELLGRHFATGQSALEDENLATLLAWITNPAHTGLDAIREAEDTLPYGPTPDPGWEADLEPHVRDYSRALRAGDNIQMRRAHATVEEAAREPMLAAYTAVHQALTTMRDIPAAASVAKRWDDDIDYWGRHARRAHHGIPRFRRRHDPLRAARQLEDWSRALEHLGADEAFDDPLVMAELDALGRCLIGQVTTVDTANREVKPGNTRRSLVPLVTLHLAGPTRLLTGETVVWAGDRRVKGTIRDVTATSGGTRVLLALTDGHDHGRRIPRATDETTFAALDVFPGRSPDDPLDVPWTHRPAEHEETGAADLIDDRAFLRADETDAGPADGSPDLEPDQILAQPAIGTIGPGDVPAVVL